MKGLVVVTGLLELMRFRFHLSFITVIAGALLFAEQLSSGLFWQLLQVYLLFNVLLYGGIYCFNDIVDKRADAAHPTKCHRPLPSERVSSTVAVFFAIALIAAAFAISWKVNPKLVPFFAAFLAANIAYSGGFKQLPYVGLSMIALTHTLRFVMGAMVAGVDVGWPFITAFYALLYTISFTIHGLFNVTVAHRKFYPGSLLLLVQGLSGGVMMLAAWGADTVNFSWMMLFSIYLIFVVWAGVPSWRPTLAFIFMAKPQQ
ncbi:UbiA family prenyltransferase [Chania multitudinisentens]|nr:UbiA family prenyltransferase [Chania multitudinisentens]